MTRLATDVAALNQLMLETADMEHALVDEVGRRLADDDERLRAALETVLAQHADRRAGIAGLIRLLTSRVGHLPPPAAHPPPLPPLKPRIDRDVASIPQSLPAADERPNGDRADMPPARLGTTADWPDESARDIWDRLEAEEYEAQRRSVHLHDPDYINGTLDQ